MTLRHIGCKKFSVEVNGGNVVCGDNCKVKINSCRRGGHARSYTQAYHTRESDVKLTGSADQLVSMMPYKVYSQLTALLTRDWLRIAGTLFHLTFEEVVMLREGSFEVPHVDGVFVLMCERQITVGQLVKVLIEIQRFDAVSALIAAGYPDVLKQNSTVNKQAINTTEGEAEEQDSKEENVTGPE